MPQKLIDEYELTPFQKQKVGEIREHLKDGHNPLDITQISSLSIHGYTFDDLRNYHMVSGSRYFAVLTHPESQNGAIAV